jgi:hypothetical protein
MHVQGVEIDEVTMHSKDFHKAFRLSDPDGNVRALLSTKDAGDFAAWSAAFQKAIRHAQTRDDATPIRDEAPEQR